MEVFLMSNGSDKAGWLTSVTPGPEYDEELEHTLSCWVSGVSGLPDDKVRSRWTSVESPPLPVDDDGCDFGIMAFISDVTPAFENQTEESTELWRHEEIECLVSFYGPNCQRYGTCFRDGLAVSQNNDELGRFGLSVDKSSQLTALPELINNQWVRCYDMTITLRRKVVREYGVKSLVEAPVKFFGD
ncbi:bacteriophage protein [Photorhabdus thracensis]|uniref:Bacteriophage protein n=2 Tax=Photorhabdus TaxID=29487 RepID=A0A0F7LVG8_9GAMM|nr:bacteriophage protein [Photorhabdus thracensis]